jgi:catechol 2,3-dioxygenase-like lactoylglutathione lyase family enzyme
MAESSQPIRTHGLTHIALGVRDVDRTFAFYERVFGMVAIRRSDSFVQGQTPGTREVVARWTVSPCEPLRRTRTRGTYGNNCSKCLSTDEHRHGTNEHGEIKGSIHAWRFYLG